MKISYNGQLEAINSSTTIPEFRQQEQVDQGSPRAVGQPQSRTGQQFELINGIHQGTPELPAAFWNPAPRIPGMILEPDIAQIMTASELGKSHDEQMKTLLNNLKSASENLDDVNKKKMEKLTKRMQTVMEQIKKQREAKLAGDITFGLSIAASILSLIGAAMLTLVSLGAAAPALVGAVIGTATTIMDGVDRGLQEGGVKYTSGPLAGKQATATIAGLVGAMWESILVSSPGFQKLPKEEQEKRIMGMQIAVTVGISVLLLGAGIAAGAGSVMKAASEGVKVANSLSSTMARVVGSLVGKGAEIAQIVTETANSASTISSSVFGTQLAFITFESNELDNQRQFFEALAEAVQRLISSSQESTENIMQSITDFIQNVSESNEQYYSISKNMTAAV
jgi:hypothetical protein